MSNNTLIRPEDVLPDGFDSTAINGTIVRKGTIAAFLANTDVLENPAVTEKQTQEAKSLMRELAPAVITIGLHKHAIFKNPEVEQILIDAEVGSAN